MNQGRQSQKKKWFLAVLCVLIVVAVGALVLQIRSWSIASQKEKYYDQLYEEAVVSVKPSSKPTEPKTEDASSEDVESEEPQVPAEELREVDFDLLKSVNADVIGWLSIPGMDVEYPVLQNMENNYYLEHNIDGSKGYPGCLYIENYNTDQFTDALTIIYGHNMRNGTMFGGLKDYRKDEYFDNCRSLYLYLPGRTVRYSLMGISYYTDSHLLDADIDVYEDGSYGFKGLNGYEGEIFQGLIKRYNDKNARFVGEFSISEEDKILVLSTCCGNPSKRFLVIWKMDVE